MAAKRGLKFTTQTAGNSFQPWKRPGKYVFEKITCKQWSDTELTLIRRLLCKTGTAELEETPDSREVLVYLVLCQVDELVEFGRPKSGCWTVHSWKIRPEVCWVYFAYHGICSAKKISGVIYWVVGIPKLPTWGQVGGQLLRTVQPLVPGWQASWVYKVLDLLGWTT